MNQINTVDSFKGAMCKKCEYLLTEMQYDIHNYVSVVYKELT